MLPAAHKGFQTLTTWGDQRQILSTVNQLSAQGRADYVENTWLGPGYATLARAFARLFGSTEVGLIVLTISSFVIIYYVLLSFLAIIASKEFKIIAFLLILFSYFSMRIYQIRDIPWTHGLVTCAILLIFFLFYSTNVNATGLGQSLMGFLIIFSWQIRNFETIGLLLGLATIFLLSRRDVFVLGRETVLKRSFFYLIGGLGAYLLTSAGSGSWKIFLQYQGSYSENIAPIDFSFSRILNRFTQVFFDPNFYTFTNGNYPDRSPFEYVYARDFEIWGQPFMYSQVLLLPSVMFLLLLLGFWVVKTFTRGSLLAKELRYSIALSVTGLSILFGYFLSPIVGSGSLKFGLFREFLLVQFCAIVSLVLVAKHILMTHPGIRPSRVVIPIFLVFGFFTVVLPSQNVNFREEITDILVSGKNCGKQISHCDLSIHVIKSDKKTKLSDQPIDIRFWCEGVQSTGWSKDFSVKIPKCEGDLSLYALPLQLGFSTTPDAESFFQSKKIVAVQVIN
jgi:hypothetical protein